MRERELALALEVMYELINTDVKIDKSEEVSKGELREMLQIAPSCDKVGR